MQIETVAECIYKYFSQFKALKILSDYSDYIIYIVVVLSLLNKFIFFGGFLDAFLYFSVFFLSVLAFAKQKYASLALLFLTFSFFAIYEIFAVILHQIFDMHTGNSSLSFWKAFFSFSINSVLFCFSVFLSGKS